MTNVAIADGSLVTESGTKRSGACALLASRSMSEVSCAEPAVCQRASNAGPAWMAEEPTKSPIMPAAMSVATRRMTLEPRAAVRRTPL